MLFEMGGGVSIKTRAGGGLSIKTGQA